MAVVVEMEAVRSKAAAPLGGGPDGAAEKAPLSSELTRTRRAAAARKAIVAAEDDRAAAVAGQTLAPAVGASSVEWAGAVCAGIDESDGAVEDER